MSVCGRTRRNGQPLDWSGVAKTAEKSSPFAFQWSIALSAAQPLDAADHVVELAEAELGHDLADVLGHEGEEAHDVLRLAGEPLAQIGVLRGDAHRAGAEVALPHQQAAERYQGRGAEAEPLGAQQGADHHVAAGLHLAVAPARGCGRAGR